MSFLVKKKVMSTRRTPKPDDVNLAANSVVPKAPKAALMSQ